MDGRGGRPCSLEEGNRIRSSSGRTRKDKGRSRMLTLAVEREALVEWEGARSLEGGCTLSRGGVTIPYGAGGNDRMGSEG